MKRLFLALSIAGFAGSPALAQMADFATTDIDGNGMVSLEEAVAAGYDWSDAQFSAADTNSDGSLSEDEFIAATAG